MRNGMGSGRGRWPFGGIRPGDIDEYLTSYHGPRPGLDPPASRPEPQPPQEGDTVVPDAIEPIVGWRTWDVNASHALESLHFETPWYPGKTMTARCNPMGPWRTVRDHDPAVAPQKRCVCGIYLRQSPVQAWREYGRHGTRLRVLGRVRAWGRCVVHQEGWRVQYAQIDALVLPPWSSALHPDRYHPVVDFTRWARLHVTTRMLARSYGVPLLAWPDTSKDPVPIAGREVSHESRS